MKTSTLAAMVLGPLALLSAAAAPAQAPPPAAPGQAVAVLAGGCFWSVEHELEQIPGVVDVVVGYAGGAKADPTYRNHEGHLEAVRVTYDPARLSYEQLTQGFFRRIDPTDPNGQICDQGPSYRTAIFYASGAERDAALRVKAEVAMTLGEPVATEIRPAARFWMGEAYHQDFAEKNPGRYQAYKVGCGRERAIRAVWASR